MSISVLLLLAASTCAQPMLPIPMRTVDLDVGETYAFKGQGKSKNHVRLIELRETRDSLRGAVRRAEVTLNINGEEVKLVSANYRLPVTIGDIRVDCPITKGYVANSNVTKGEDN